MAILRIKNQTSFKMVVPVADVRVGPYASVDATVTDIDQFYNNSSIQKLRSKGKIAVTLISDSTPGAEGDAVLPLLTAAELPPAASNPGMMVFNTTDGNIQVSNGASWITITIIPVFSSGVPSPVAFPDGYVLWDATTQSILVDVGGTYFRTIAAGVRSYPSHIIPPANTVIAGTVVFDTDNKILRVSDGTRWLTTAVVEEHSVHSLPTITDYPFGALLYVNDEYSLRVRIGGSWLTVGGRLKYFELASSLPTSPQFNNDQRGVAVYVNEDRSIRFWDGKYWIYPSMIPPYPTASLPDAANLNDGYTAYDTTLSTIMVDIAGKWIHPAPVAPHFAAGSRPKASDVPYGYMIFNTTSGKPNWSDGANWVDGVGTVDP